MTATTSWDNLNRVKSVSTVNSQNAAVATHAYTLNALGQRTVDTLADGSRWTYDYDPVTGEVTGGHRRNANGGATAGMHDYTYQFDSIGNRLGTTQNGRAASYTPNSLNQYI